MKGHMLFKQGDNTKIANIRDILLQYHRDEFESNLIETILHKSN